MKEYEMGVTNVPPGSCVVVLNADERNLIKRALYWKYLDRNGLEYKWLMDELAKIDLATTSK